MHTKTSITLCLIMLQAFCLTQTVPPKRPACVPPLNLSGLPKYNDTLNSPVQRLASCPIMSENFEQKRLQKQEDRYDDVLFCQCCMGGCISCIGIACDSCQGTGPSYSLGAACLSTAAIAALELCTITKSEKPKNA